MPEILERFTTKEIVSELTYRLVKAEPEKEKNTITVSELNDLKRLAGLLNQHIYLLQIDKP